ncbi:MAG: DUF6263 family protein [Cystobacterineae bacterium]|nr:DUF6263 family protein [Cystobacterineae bacterium]
MKKILLISLFLLSSLAIAAEPIHLSFNPPKGAKYEQRMEATQSIHAGESGPMETKMDVTFLMEILEKTTEEVHMRLSYKGMAYTVSTGMGKMKFSSGTQEKKKGKAEDSIETEIEKKFRKIFNMLIGKPFTIVVAPDGSVKSIAGLDVIRKSMAQAIADEGSMAQQIGASIEEWFSDASMKDLFEQSLKIYPNKAVRTGESWNVEFSRVAGGMNLLAKTTYTLKEVKQNIAVVAFESDIGISLSAAIEGKLTGKQTGTLSLNPQTGMLLTSNASQSAEGSLKAQGVDLPMKLSTQAKVSSKEVKK